MANGWERLGEVFAGTAAGGNDSYTRGVSKQAQLAQLLAGAQIKQDEAMARDELLGSMIANGTARPEAAMLSTMLRMGADPTKISGYHGDVQTQGFQSEAMDAARSGNVPLLNDIMTAISGKPRQTATMSEGTLFDPYGAVGQSVNVTPVGQSTIGQRNASAASSYATAARTRQAQQIDLMKEMRAGAGGTAAPGQPKPASAADIKAQQAVTTKAAQLGNVTRGLDRIQSALGGLSGALFDTGPLDQYVMRNTPAGQELDAAVGAIQNSMLALTRVPGVGSQSDLEARIAALQYPSLGVAPEVNARTMRQLRDFVTELQGVSIAPNAAPPAGGGVDDLLGKYGIR